MTRRLAFSTQLDAEQIAALRDLSSRTRVPQSVHIRAALDAYLALHEEPGAEGQATPPTADTSALGASTRWVTPHEEDA
jgi:predicted transcriptional regulator